MSTHALALTVAFLLVANYAMILGMPGRSKVEWTSEKRIKVVLGVIFDVFVIWLLVRVA